MLFLVLGQAVGLERMLGEDACDPGCEDDAEGRDCPPACPTCACSPRLAPSVPSAPPAAFALPPAPARLAFPETDRTPSVPDPREILRVPIAVLA